MLALRIHGGLRRHNEMYVAPAFVFPGSSRSPTDRTIRVVARRIKTQELIKDELRRSKGKSEGRLSGRYSKYLEMVLSERPIEVVLPNTSQRSDLATNVSLWRRQVKQFAPLRRISEDDWSDDCSWYHHPTRELIEERDLVP